VPGGPQERPCGGLLLHDQHSFFVGPQAQFQSRSLPLHIIRADNLTAGPARGVYLRLCCIFLTRGKLLTKQAPFWAFIRKPQANKWLNIKVTEVIAGQ
jgi:hypothetical protein